MKKERQHGRTAGLIMVVGFFSVFVALIIACFYMIATAPTVEERNASSAAYCAQECGWEGHNYVRTERGTFCICGPQ